MFYVKKSEHYFNMIWIRKIKDFEINQENRNKIRKNPENI